MLWVQLPQNPGPATQLVLHSLIESHHQTSRITGQMHLRRFISATSIYSPVRTKCHTVLVILSITRNEFIPHLYSSTLPSYCKHPSPPEHTHLFFTTTVTSGQRWSLLVSMCHFFPATDISNLPNLILYGHDHQAPSVFSVMIVLWTGRGNEYEE